MFADEEVSCEWNRIVDKHESLLLASERIFGMLEFAYFRIQGGFNVAANCLSDQYLSEELSSLMK